MTKLYCPNCKNEFNHLPIDRFYLRQRQEWTIKYCYPCRRPYFEIDCPTEEQLIEHDGANHNLNKEYLGDDWINFADRKPEIGQQIEARMDNNTNLLFKGKFVEIIDLNIGSLKNNEKYYFYFTEWKPVLKETSAYIKEGHSVDRIIATEKSLDGINDVQRDVDNIVAVESKENLVDLIRNSPMMDAGDIFHNVFKHPEEKSIIERIRELERSHQTLRNEFALNYDAQSQIAINKVIEALEPLCSPEKSPNYDNPVCFRDFNFWKRQVIEKLKELNHE